MLLTNQSTANLGIISLWPLSSRCPCAQERPCRSIIPNRSSALSAGGEGVFGEVVADVKQREARLLLCHHSASDIAKQVSTDDVVTS